LLPMWRKNISTSDIYEVGTLVCEVDGPSCLWAFHNEVLKTNQKVFGLILTPLRHKSVSHLRWNRCVDEAGSSS